MKTDESTNWTAGTGEHAAAGDSLVNRIPSGDLRDAANRLVGLARKVERFLIEQFRELDGLLAQSRWSAEPEHAARAGRAELQQLQAAWERRRNEEYQSIERERLQLAEAWARVEAEQRRLIAEEALRRAQATSARDPAATPGNTTAQRDSAHDRTTEEMPLDGALAASELELNPSSVLEYGQLKDDVRRHARRVRRFK